MSQLILQIIPLDSTFTLQTLFHFAILPHRKTWIFLQQWSSKFFLVCLFVLPSLGDLVKLCIPLAHSFSVFSFPLANIFSLTFKSFRWIRKWLPTPAFLSGEFHGQRSLAGYIGSKWVRHDWRDFAHMTIHFQKPAKEREGPPSLPEVPHFSNNALGQIPGQRSSQESPKVLNLAYEKEGLCTKVLS